MKKNNKNIFELRKMTIEQLSKYYMEHRKIDFDNNVPLKNIDLRKKIHKLLLLLVKIDRLISKEKLEVINDDRIETNRPKIYACTHIGGNDVQRAFEAIEEHAYLFIGDLRGIYKDEIGVMLHLNGMIPLETNNKNDRQIAGKRALELLKKGGNLLIYPEGAWNITQNLPVMDLYKGASYMALDSKADIIPLAIEQYDDKFYVSIGKNIETSKLNGINPKELTELLRDKMATEKWRIWKHYGEVPREEVASIKLPIFQQEIIDKCEYGFTMEDLEATRYHDKNKISEEEVFAFQKKLIR